MNADRSDADIDEREAVRSIESAFQGRGSRRPPPLFSSLLAFACAGLIALLVGLTLHGIRLPGADDGSPVVAAGASSVTPSATLAPSPTPTATPAPSPTRTAALTSIQSPTLARIPTPTPTSRKPRFRLAVWDGRQWRFDRQPAGAAYGEGDVVPIMLRIDRAQTGDVYDLTVRHDCGGFDILTAHDRDEVSRPALASDGPGIAIADTKIRIFDDLGTATDGGEVGSLSLWGGTFMNVRVPTPFSACSGEQSLAVSLSAAADTVFLIWAAQVSERASDGAAPVRLAAQVQGGEELTLEIKTEGPGPPQFMPMPVEGTWRVTCGYRCALHNEEHISTFAVDIARADGDTAGQRVRAPVEGRVIVVSESSTAICRGKTIEGPEAGAAVVIEFQAPSGARRLRLVHIDPASVPDDLRPDGRPVPVQAGTVLGSLAEMDGCSHLHVSITRLEAGREIPEPLTINGALLEDCGGENCWGNALLPGQQR